MSRCRTFVGSRRIVSRIQRLHTCSGSDWRSDDTRYQLTLPSTLLCAPALARVPACQGCRERQPSGLPSHDSTSMSSAPSNQNFILRNRRTSVWRRQMGAVEVCPAQSGTQSHSSIFAPSRSGALHDDTPSLEMGGVKKAFYWS